MKTKTRLMERWLHQPTQLDCKYGTVIGTILYGNRRALAPGNTRLIETDPSRDGDYWFVNETQDVKVRLSGLKGGIDELNGFGRDNGRFEVTLIRR